MTVEILAEFGLAVTEELWPNHAGGSDVDRRD
jgi:hypothetical protein